MTTTTLPDVYPNILDGALGIAPPNTSHVHLKLGCAPLGILNTLQSFGNSTALTEAFGPGGDLVEAIGLALEEGGPVLGINVNPTTYGSPGSVTKSVSLGSSTMTVTGVPFSAFIAKIVATGVRGTATAQFSFDGGNTYGPVVTTGATLQIPNAPFITVAFNASSSYTAGDQWSVSASGSITFTGSGNNGLTVSSTCPVGRYNVVVNCIAGGALGAATFQYSLDNGNDFSGTILVPGSGLYVIPNTGLLLTFSGTLVANEQWTCAVTSATYNTTDFTTAWNSAVASPLTWAFAHAVGPASSVSGAAAFAAAVEALLVTANGNYRYARGIIEVPSDTDANTLSAFASTATPHVMWCAGFAYIQSAVNPGQQWLASSGWAIASRASQSDVANSEALGYVGRGPLASVSLTAINPNLPAQRNEEATPALDAGRFTTLRSILGVAGVFITNGRLGANYGSDYTFWQFGRVIDIAAATSRQALLPFISASVRVNANGTIFEKDAQKIENVVISQLRTALTQPGDASAVAFQVSRTQNVLSTGILPCTTTVTSLGYTLFITVNVGFTPIAAAST